MFAFQTLGVMADAAEAIATDADVSVGHPHGETRLPSCVTYMQHFGAPRYVYEYHSTTIFYLPCCISLYM